MQASLNTDSTGSGPRQPARARHVRQYNILRDSILHAVCLHPFNANPLAGVHRRSFLDQRQHVTDAFSGLDYCHTFGSARDI
ncbi:hypothetical protein EVAR_51297_1 [Eumeta japonica]|uniref:Uncharacterized protein n=1 Tax=Eumeta variegata TaxID=151549 RepID=A0A4C1XRI0_EUMVA|nr:hypothetical protein EVAR_51297_1 [Eumeta japonica]